MVLIFPPAKLHALLSAVQVSTQDNISVMFVNASQSLEVALDALQRSVFVSASGNAKLFYASVQCGCYHHGVPLPFQQFLGCIFTDHLRKTGVGIIFFFLSLVCSDAFSI